MVLLQDIRFAARVLWKHRLATLVSVLALALGIGANTAMFSVAEAFLLHPVPFEDANRLVALLDARSTGNGPAFGQEMTPVAVATYLDWKQQAHSFSQLTAYAWDEVNLTGDKAPQKVQAFHVAANFFATLGVQPRLGRVFLPEEETPGKEQEIILGNALWEQRYASDPQIVGKNIKVGGKSYTVVGVMGKGFDFPNPAEAWLPLYFETKDRLNRDARWIYVLGRLKPGATFPEASAEMTSLERREAQAYPDSYKGFALQPRLLPEYVTGTLTRQYTLLLLGAVGFVLLIACLNVANVQFARVTGRSREFAVRTAIGGSRWRIVRQLLTESLLLSFIGAAVGLFIAQWNIRMIVDHMPPDVAKFIAGWKTISLDLGAFLFTLVIAALSGIISGIAPSLLSSRTHLSETLKESGRGSSFGSQRHRLRGALVVSEIALALILLVGAGLLVRSFRGLLEANQQSNPQTLLTMNLTLPDTQYPDASARRSFYQSSLQRLSTLPGIQSAMLVTALPYSNGGGANERAIAIEGRPPAERGERVASIVETVSPNYFATMNIPTRDGRLLADSDADATQPVCVISESLARRYFPGLNPLGHKIKVGKTDEPGSWMTVVGIVSDVHYSWIDKAIIPTLYRSYRQSPPQFAVTLALRTQGNPLDFISAVRSQMAGLDPELPLYNLKTFDKVITESIIGIAYVAAMMAILGLVALLLASIGVYGVMSYSVSERVHEIGIRMSLGAETRDILRLVLRNGLALTALGLAIGVPLALLMARGMSSLLFEVKSTDPLTFIGLPLLLALIALLACYIPAQRAARVDPLKALRHE
ncbi:MAG TPA: ABC transporter permease [Candidatus Acidoferrales bacterium]|nr:ABC transporter permease [Candidatus Acidoferrales bacterium]